MNSVKTTVTGIVAGIVELAGLFGFHLSADNPMLNHSVALFVLAVGAIWARDNDKTDKKAGAK